MPSIKVRTSKTGKKSYQVNYRAGFGRDAPERAKTFSTMKAAKEFEATLVLRGAVDDRVGKLTFTKFRDQWLERQWELTKSSGTGQKLLKPGSVTVYGRASGHLLPTLGNLQLASITEAHCRDALLYVAARVSPAYVKLIRTTGRKMFDDLVARGVMPRNPMPGEAAFKVGKQRVTTHGSVKTPTPEQVMQMVDKAPSFEMRCLILFAASTGLRRSELCGLRWTDVLLDVEPYLVMRRTVTVQYDQQGKRYIDVADHGKTPAAMREFPMSKMEATILRGLHEHQVAACRAARVKWSPNAYLWPRARNKPHEAQNPHKMTEKARRVRNAAGVPKDISPIHGLRHASATAMLGTVPDAVVARRMGHASPAVTQAVYQHPTKHHMEQASRASEAAWGKALQNFLDSDQG